MLDVTFSQQDGFAYHSHDRWNDRVSKCEGAV